MAAATSSGFRRARQFPSSIICIGIYVGWQGLHALSVAGAI
jgi:hypothetical protein